jgi:hypothetical protein
MVLQSNCPSCNLGLPLFFGASRCPRCGVEVAVYAVTFRSAKNTRLIEPQTTFISFVRLGDRKFEMAVRASNLHGKQGFIADMERSLRNARNLSAWKRIA